MAHFIDKLLGRRRTVSAPKSVLLTFDDGPDPNVTPAVLDLLKTYGARAVFFVVGSRIDRAPQLLHRILAEGHLIGNHTYAHQLEKDPWPISYLFDVRRCQSLLKDLTGEVPRLFRAPMGRRSLGALLTPSILGLRHILWSADSGDWTLRSEEAALSCGRQLCDSVKSGDIILLHDDNPWVVTVLDRLLPHLAKQGVDLHSAIDIL